MSSAPPLSRRQRRRANAAARRNTPGGSGGTSTFDVPVAFTQAGRAEKNERASQELAASLQAYDDELWVREMAVSVVCTKPRQIGRYAFFPSDVVVSEAIMATASHSRPFCKGVTTSLSYPGGRVQIKDLKKKKLTFSFESDPLPANERASLLACTLHLRFETQPSTKFPRDSDPGNATAIQFYMQQVNT